MIESWIGKTLRWNPAHTTHAIDRMSLTFRFQTVPLKPFGRIAKRIKSYAVEKGLTEQVELQQPNFGFEIGPDGIPRPLASSNQNPTAFLYRKVEGDAVILEIGCTPDNISIIYYQYNSWEQFILDARHILASAINEILDIVDLIDLRLEYWNRFVPATDGNGHFLLSENSKYIGSFASKHTTSLHTHLGFFIEGDDFHKRLVNANIDVNIASDLTPPQPGQVDTAFVYSLVSLEADGKSSAEDYLGPLCESSHRLLKNVLNDIFTVEMVDAIALNAADASRLEGMEGQWKL